MAKKGEREWQFVENDLLSMVMYFYRHSGPMSYQTYKECAEETGIPESTVKYYVKYYEKDRNCWFLGVVANKFGYIARYVNGPRIKVYVEKKRFI